MIKRVFFSFFAVLFSFAMVATNLLVLRQSPGVQAASPIRYVANIGNDDGNNCTNSTNPCASLQKAIDEAAWGDEIQMAGGVYSSSGTLGTFQKELKVIGGYSSDFSTFDPEEYQTILDAEMLGSVISITNAGNVHLAHLILTNGNGQGNCPSLSSGCGGGIYASGTNLQVEQCTIINNKASTTGSGFGGGIYASANGNTVEIWESQINENTASFSSTLSSQYGNGGGIFIHKGTASVWGNEITGNVGSVHHSGVGGIYLSDMTQANVMSNTIRNNHGNMNPTWWSGAGGIAVSGYSQNVNIYNNLIENNQSSDGAGLGGGINVWDSQVNIFANTIRGNISGELAGNGGGVYILNSTLTVSLTNNLIIENQSPVGGGVYVTMGGYPVAKVSLTHNTIAENGSSGVVADRYATITLTNNIIARHDVGIQESSPADITIVADTNLFANQSDLIFGSNAILDAPLFSSDYHLHFGSPAIDAGLTLLWVPNDLDGIPRPQGSAYDLGAYEGDVPWQLYIPLVVGYSTFP